MLFPEASYKEASVMAECQPSRREERHYVKKYSNLYLRTIITSHPIPKNKFTYYNP